MVNSEIKKNIHLVVKYEKYQPRLCDSLGRFDLQHHAHQFNAIHRLFKGNQCYVRPFHNNGIKRRKNLWTTVLLFLLSSPPILLFLPFSLPLPAPASPAASLLNPGPCCQHHNSTDVQMIALASFSFMWHSQHSPVSSLPAFQSRAIALPNRRNCACLDEQYKASQWRGKLTQAWKNRKEHFRQVAQRGEP